MYIVCAHEPRHWFENEGSTPKTDYRDVLLDQIMILGLNVEVLFDDIMKLKIENITVYPEVTGTGSIELKIMVQGHVPTRLRKGTEIPRMLQLLSGWII